MASYIKNKLTKLNGLFPNISGGINALVNDFFRNLKLIKENGLYVKGAHKKDKGKKMCELPNAQNIIFIDIYLQNYDSWINIKMQ